jgi:hypothetical protein
MLLYNLLRDEKHVILIKSTSPHGDSLHGDRLIGDFQISFSNASKSRQELYAEIAATLSRSSLSRVLCVPLSEDDLRTAVAAADITGAPLALYFIDTLIAGHRASLDSVLQEALNKS